jgi:hypothetical protein
VGKNAEKGRADALAAFNAHFPYLAGSAKLAEQHGKALGKTAVCAGTLLCDGSWKCEDFQPARGTLYDTVCAPVFPDGAYRCDGSFDCSGYIKIYDPKTFTVPIIPTDGAEDTFVFESGPPKLRMPRNVMCNCAYAFLENIM